MRTRHRRTAGRLPEIHLEGDSIAFYLEIVGAPWEHRLVIRCNDDGDVLSAIVEPEMEDLRLLERPRATTA